MITVCVALLAITMSALMIVVLCLGDPKRQRASHRRAKAMLPRQRRLLVALACSPGLGCMLLGNPAAFMLWLGGCALVGWASAAWFRAVRQGEGAIAS